MRFAAGRTMPFEDKSHDGNVTGTYSFEITGEDTASPTMTIAEASVHYEDEMSLTDGAARHYICESLVPASGDQITWTHAAS